MILAELSNWQENRTAVLEYANDCIYLYSHPHQEGESFKALWVVNTAAQETPENSIVVDMRNGDQPYMPMQYCEQQGVVPDYQNQADWRLQWGLDQNSVAVYFKEVLVAVMPEWSGYKGFSGYSVGTHSETEIAWPLTPDNEQIERFARESQFLDAWDDDTWPRYQSGALRVYESFPVEEERYFAADGGQWPPLGIHYGVTKNTQFWATVGMSILPMPVFGMNYDNPEKYRKIELAILVNATEDTMPLGSYLSAQARYPWLCATHFDHGHTIPCQQLKELGSEMEYMLLLEQADFLPEFNHTAFFDDDTRILFMLPIYGAEQTYAEQNGSDGLIQRMQDLEVDLFCLKRQSVL